VTPVVVAFGAFVATLVGGLAAWRFRDQQHLILGLSWPAATSATATTLTTCQHARGQGFKPTVVGSASQRVPRAAPLCGRAPLE
jgi:hypothetical protein